MMSGFVDKSNRNINIAKTVDKIAAATGRSSAQIALNWLARQEIIPIIGARKLSHLKDNLDCINFSLDSQHIEELNQASQIKLGFPHEFYQQDMVRNLVYNGTFDAIELHRYSQIK